MFKFYAYSPSRVNLTHVTLNIPLQTFKPGDHQALDFKVVNDSDDYLSSFQLNYVWTRTLACLKSGVNPIIFYGIQQIVFTLSLCLPAKLFLLLNVFVRRWCPRQHKKAES